MARAATREIGTTRNDVTPALTTVRMPLSDIGYQAFRATVDADWQQTPLPLEVIVRQSTPGIGA